MKKNKRNKLVTLGILSMGAVALAPAIALSCKPTKQEKPEPLPVPKPEPQPQPQPQPTPLPNPNPLPQPTPADETSQGGTVNGIIINAYKSLLNVLNITNAQTAYQVYNKINTKSFKSDKYAIENVNVVSFDDATGQLSFKVTGTYEQKSLNDLTFTLSGLLVVSQTKTANITFDMDKVFENKLAPNYFVGKSVADILPYLKTFTLTFNNENTIDILNNPEFTIKRFDITQKPNNLIASISVEYTSHQLSQAGLNQNASNIFFDTNRNVNVLNYSTTAYLNYVNLHHVHQKENIKELAAESYASFYQGKKQAHMDYTHTLLEIDNDYAEYNKTPIQLVSTFVADDETGVLTLHTSCALPLDEREISSEAIENKISGFKTLSQADLSKMFFAVINHADMAKNFKKLFNMYNAAENKDTFSLDNNSMEFKSIFGDAIARQMLIRESENGYTLGNANNKIYVIATINGGNDEVVGILKESAMNIVNFDDSTGIIDNAFQVKNLVLTINSVSDFKLSTGKHDRLDFKVNYTITIGIDGNNGENQIEINSSATTFVINK
ncbi:hypothetical protein [Mycoplasma seminis]|uniref:Variable surface lipoprotein n=1 Tax=Mycoplasma seminis TaxID=512749 RepID=A0ABY9HAB7_9MOLU|nr:hypothetical protein [Mycoplasma seminis]WLP85537.1 hypothetical protein Q8852_04445 [Mycoplasma seminis]